MVNKLCGIAIISIRNKNHNNEHFEHPWSYLAADNELLYVIQNSIRFVLVAKCFYQVVKICLGEKHIR